MKHFIKKLFLIVILVGSFAGGVSAQDYELLQPLPLGGTERTSVTPSEYIGGMFMLIIGIAGVLAVIMIIVGGIKYMTTDAMGGKNDAKKTIQNAIFGLLLALGAWIILYSINERLVNLNINISQVPAASTTPPAAQQPWFDDSSIRNYLSGTVGITINNRNCAYIGETGCTSVYQLGSGAQNGLIALRQACQNCTIVITGGTEYWNHGNRSTDLSQNPTGHRPGGNVVDLRRNTVIDSHIGVTGQLITGRNNCSNLGAAYRVGNATYVNEGNHWHVCY